MTTLASNAISQTNVAAAPNQSTSSTSSASPPTTTNSGQSDSKVAAVPAGSRNAQAPVSYAAATKKPSYTPPIVSSTATTSVPVVGGATGQNARNTNALPVNGKTQIPPAVPSVNPPASGNVIVNGASSPAINHSRKSSQAGGNAWMQNGGPHGVPMRPQQSNQNSILFGSFPGNLPNSTTTGNSAVSSPNLSAPALASNPRVSSPQTSPSPLPQPAASGGPLQSPAIRGPNITFGSLDPTPPDGRDRPPPHGRAPPLQSVAPLGPASQTQPPARRNSASAHSGHVEISQSGVGLGRGMPPNNNSRRGGNTQYGSQHYMSQNPPYSSTYGSHYNKHASNNARNHNAAVNNGGQYPNGPAQMGGYPGPRAPRSPAMQQVAPHSLPPTPQLGSASMTTSSPSFQSANLPPYHPHQYMHHMEYPYGAFAPPPPHMFGYNLAPPGSPRAAYQQMGPVQSNYMQPHSFPVQPPPMSRSSSTAAAADIHRPASSMSHPPLPQQTIPQPSSAPPNQSALNQSGLNSSAFARKKPTQIVIRDPSTNTVQTFSGREQIPTPAQLHSPAPVTTHSAPPTSSSGPVIVQSAPSPALPEGTKEKSVEQKRMEMQEQVRLKLEAAMAEKKAVEEERLKKEREQKEAEEKRKQEEEEKKRKKEEEEEEERKRKEEEKHKEEEQKKRKEEEEEAERLRKKAEEEARLEDEKRRREAEEAEAARIAQEKAEEESRITDSKEEEAKRLKEGMVTEEDRGKANKEEEVHTIAEGEIKSKAELADTDQVEPIKEAEDAPKVAENVPLPTIIPPKPSDEGTVPLKKGKPQPLVLHTKTSTEPGLPSAALTALRSARFIDDINSVQYPSNILSPNPALNQNAPVGKFKYGKDFLLQFQSVFTEKPSVDWDQRIRDTVGDPTDSARLLTTRQPTSGLGPRGSRTGLPTPTSTPLMGTMGAFGSGKSFPPANMLTSQQRFEQSTRQQLGALPPSGFPGGFRPVPPSLSRTNSSTGLAQQAPPQSPRAGSRSQRGSRRGTAPVVTIGAAGISGGVAMEKSDSKRSEIEPKQTLTIPLSDVKPLESSATRWKPRVQQQTEAKAAPTPAAALADDRLSPELVQRKVKAALNKMTPEKFDKISDQILEIASQSKTESDGRTLRQVIQLTFEKATDEAAWSSMYAKFCKRMLESMDPSIKDESIRDKNGSVVTGGNLFRKYLLNRCQEEFERGWKVNLPPKPEGVTDEAAMLSDEYYTAAAAKRRGLGLIQFIGELFKLGMLTERIMHECVKKLVDYEGVPEEEEVESLCKLLRTIGRSLDSTEKSKSMVDVYFKRINLMIDHPQLPSRIRFMLMDIVDLRRKAWESNEADKGPKTRAEIREDVLKAQQEKEAAARAQQQRRPIGRGDGRSFSSSGFNHQQDQRVFTNTVNTDDLRKLQNRNKNITSGQGGSTFGPPSMFARSGSSSGSKKMALGFGREDSNPSSRTGTPPAGAQRESTNSKNPFGILADQTSPPHDGDNNDSISPAVSAASSPPTAKARLDDRVRPLLSQK